MVTEIQVPQGFLGTRPEWLVFEQLTRMGIDFDYQSSQMGGRMERGGSVLDFWIPDLNLALNIQSVYWHYGRPDQVRRDRGQREALEGQGIRVIYLDEEDILRNAKYFVSQALQGFDHSRMEN